MATMTSLERDAIPDLYRKRMNVTFLAAKRRVEVWPLWGNSDVTRSLGVTDPFCRFSKVRDRVGNSETPFRGEVIHEDSFRL